jgi:hypothetical protein
VGALLIGNPKITAGLAPLHAVRREPATAMAMLGEQVGQFMEQGLLHLGLRDFPQGWIQPDLPPRSNGNPRGGPHAGIPTDNDQRRKLGGERMQQ